MMKNRFLGMKMGSERALTIPDHEKPGKRAENPETPETSKI